MASILNDEFERAASVAVKSAIRDLLDHGIPIFYRDERTGIEIMEQPDGRRFEIRYIPGAAADRNYEIVREVEASAA